MRVIITTFDGHVNILEANKCMMDKHGGANLDVTVLGFNSPDFDMGHWKFVSMCEYITANNFSNDISPFFQDFNDEYFIMGNDDVVLTTEFNHNFLSEIIDTIKEIPNFGRIWLTSPLSYDSKIIKDFGDYQIGEIKQSSKYRLSLQYSIWKTSYFKKYLIPNLNPWQWELRNDAKNDGASILIPINNFVVSIGHIMRNGKLLPEWYNSLHVNEKLSDEDRKICENIFKKHKYLN